jgi:hypothetical protein
VVRIIEAMLWKKRVPRGRWRNYEYMLSVTQYFLGTYSERVNNHAEGGECHDSKDSPQPVTAASSNVAVSVRGVLVER